MRKQTKHSTISISRELKNQLKEVQEKTKIPIKHLAEKYIKAGILDQNQTKGNF